MNGIEKITDRIRAEAEAEAAAMLSEAEKSADAVRADFAAKAAELEKTMLGQGTEEIWQKVQRAERASRLEAKKDILALKQELVSEAYRRATEKILAMPEDDYAAFLAREAGNAALTGKEEIILNPADRERLGDKVTAAANALAAKRGLPGEMKLSDKTRPMAGGVVLRQGDIEVNCALESLLELSRGALDADVARILFQ